MCYRSRFPKKTLTSKRQCQFMIIFLVLLFIWNFSWNFVIKILTPCIVQLQLRIFNNIAIMLPHCRPRGSLILRTHMAALPEDLNFEYSILSPYVSLHDKAAILLNLVRENGTSWGTLPQKSSFRGLWQQPLCLRRKREEAIKGCEFQRSSLTLVRYYLDPEWFASLVRIFLPQNTMFRMLVNNEIP